MIDICFAGDLCIFDQHDDCYPIVPIVSDDWDQGNASFVDIDTRHFIAHSRADLPWAIEQIKNLREDLSRERSKSRRLEGLISGRGF